MCTAHILRHKYYDKLKNMCTAHILHKSWVGVPACLMKILVFRNFITIIISVLWSRPWLCNFKISDTINAIS